MKGHTSNGLEYFPIFYKKLGAIIHYTCNAPSLQILNKYRIKCLGGEFGCADIREVLQIPLNVYNKVGFLEINNKNVLKINLEKLMVILGNI